MLNIAVVGAGNWGKNLVRNFYEIKEANLKICCDLNEVILCVDPWEMTGAYSIFEVELRSS